MARSLRLVAVGFVMSLLLSTVSTTASAEGLEPVDTKEVKSAQVVGIGTDCEEMTDSILRLYFAYFLRFPDQAGFDYWVDKYQTGWGLTRISEFFATAAPEFQELYGDVTDAEFVQLLYQNVLFREPDQAGYDFWLGKLQEGVRRGTVMLSFSESEEFVNGNDVVPGSYKPLAGYLRWYPTNTFWACGSGNEVFPLNRDFNYIDFAVWNSSTSTQVVNVQFLDINSNIIDQIDITLEANWIINSYNCSAGTADGAPAVRSVRFSGSPTQVVTLVLYDQAMPKDRPGWSADLNLCVAQ